MSICIVPLTPTTLAYRFEGRITFADLDGLRHDEAPHFDVLDDTSPITVIVDFSRLHTIPPDLFPRLPELRFVRDPHVRVVFVVGANAYLRALAISLGTVLTRPPFVFRRTLEDALRSVQPPPGQNEDQTSGNFTYTSVSRS